MTVAICMHCGARKLGDRIRAGESLAYAEEIVAEFEHALELEADQIPLRLKLGCVGFVVVVVAVIIGLVLLF